LDKTEIFPKIAENDLFKLSHERKIPPSKFFFGVTPFFYLKFLKKSRKLEKNTIFRKKGPLDPRVTWIFRDGAENTFLTFVTGLDERRSRLFPLLLSKREKSRSQELKKQGCLKRFRKP